MNPKLETKMKRETLRYVSTSPTGEELKKQYDNDPYTAIENAFMAGWKAAAKELKYFLCWTDTEMASPDEAGYYLVMLENTTIDTTFFDGVKFLLNEDENVKYWRKSTF
ncbi:MAG: hypothetical protein LBE91_08260 [Tannerella sp.]|jgi:hypothetical protein|nr:hypothetical protein [Tannerella sp.]